MEIGRKLRNMKVNCYVLVKNSHRFPNSACLRMDHHLAPDVLAHSEDIWRYTMISTPSSSLRARRKNPRCAIWVDGWRCG